MVGNAAKAAGCLLMLAAVALLLAPFVNFSHRDAEFLPAAAKPPKPHTSIGVMFRSGDSLLSVLRRVGVEAPSAHGLIEKVRPLVNLRKLRPGNNIRVTLDGEDKTVRAMVFVVALF